MFQFSFSLGSFLLGVQVKVSITLVLNLQQTLGVCAYTSKCGQRSCTVEFIITDQPTLLYILNVHASGIQIVKVIIIIIIALDFIHKILFHHI